jgi:hypothetical protein
LFVSFHYSCILPMRAQASKPSIPVVSSAGANQAKKPGTLAEIQRLQRERQA